MIGVLGAEGKCVWVTMTSAVQPNEQLFMQSEAPTHERTPVCSPTGSVTQRTERRCDSWNHFSVKAICVPQVWVSGWTWLKCHVASGRPEVKHRSGGKKTLPKLSKVCDFLKKVSGMIFRQTVRTLESCSRSRICWKALFIFKGQRQAEIDQKSICNLHLNFLHKR